MITPQYFSEFRQSDVASEAEAKLKEEIPETIQQADFYHVRNYLLFSYRDTHKGLELSEI